VGFVAFDRDSQYVITGGNNNQITVWSVGGDTAARRAATVAVASRPLAISPDGILAYASGLTTLVLVDVRDPVRPRKLAMRANAHNDSLLDAAFSPDGRLLATSGFDAIATVWDVSAGTRIVRRALLPNGTGQAEGLAFSADGHLLAAGSAAGIVRLWDVSSPRSVTGVGVLKDHKDSIAAIVFDGADHLMTAGWDHRLMTYDVHQLVRDIAQPVARACELVGAGLDREHWSDYAPDDIAYQPTCQ
jgi:WD40 repeat protein